jgi:hypothetical protein
MNFCFILEHFLPQLDPKRWEQVQFRIPFWNPLQGFVAGSARK